MESIRNLLFPCSSGLILALLLLSVISSLLALYYFTKMRQWRHFHSIQSMIARRLLHEVRDPLNGILGYAEILSSGYYGELRSLQQEAIGKILACGRKLANFTKQSSSLLTNQHGYLSLELCTVNLKRLIESLIAGNPTNTVKSKSVGIKIGDKAKLSSAFHSIIEFICLSSKRQDSVRVSIGETKNVVHIVFVLHLLGNTTTPPSLSLVKLIIEMHKGTFRLKVSQKGRARLHVVIPKKAV